MFMTTDFPDRLSHTTDTLAFPTLTVECQPSRTASALLQADVGWRSGLDREELSLSSLMSSMQDLAGRFLHIDASLAADLDRR